MTRRALAVSTMLLFVSGTLTLPLPAQTAGTLQITAKKKVGSKESKERKIWRGGPILRKSSKDVSYEFGIRNMSPQNPTSVTAEWALLKKGPDEQLRIAQKGRESINLKLGQITTVVTPPITLDQHDLSGRKRSDTLNKDEIEGYGIRLIDPSFTVIGDHFSSPEVKNAFAQLMESQEEKSKAVRRNDERLKRRRAKLK